MDAKPFSVPVDGGQLAALRYLSAASAPVVVAVHGITSNGRSWGPVARVLRSRAELVAVDLRGRGGSRELPEPYGIDQHVADLVAVADHLELDRSVFVGHSLGAYIVARLAEHHPERTEAVVLVDGGLPVPGSQGADPHQFTEALLGPALARFALSFPDLDAYVQWWSEHPAFSHGQAESGDIRAYAEPDLVGQAPELRPSVATAAVRTDAEDLVTLAGSASRVQVPATLLVAPRGLQNQPDRPMQPLELAEAWAAQDPRRQARLVDDVNHYTITLGRGAPAVADAIAGYLTGAT